MRVILRILSLIFVLSYGLESIGQQHTFIHYTSEDGLPQSQVNDIIQDHEGFIWISTNGGLSRFDGKTFENYSTLNGLTDNQVFSLDIDKYNQLWILSLTGLTKYNGHTFTFFPMDFNPGTLKELYCDQDTVWFGCSNGLVKFFDEKFTLFSVEAVNDNAVNDIQRDKEGNLWVFMHEDAYIFDGKTLNTSSRKHLPWIIKVIETDDDTYMASDEFGVYKNYNDSSAVFHNQNGQITSSYVKDMAIENDNKSIWLATKNYLQKWDGENVLTIDENNGLGYNNIKVIYIDRENVLWIGTDGSGLLRYTGDLISTYTTKDGLSSNLIMSITEMNDEMFVLSYNKGIDKILQDTIQPIFSSQGAALGTGWCMASINGHHYAGYILGLVDLYKNKSTIYFSKGQQIANSRITSLFWDEIDQALLIGSQNGYTRLKNDQFTIISTEDGFPLAGIRLIRRDIEENLWFAGKNGVAKYDGENYQVFDESSGLPSKSTYNLAFYNNKVWVGTQNGLCYIENDSITIVPLGNTTKDLSINILTNDNRGRLWIGTNNGIYAIQMDKNESINLMHYGIHNGLLGLETNMNASYVDKEGNMFFGFEKGLVRFDRQELQKLELNSPPKTILTDLQIYLKDIDWNSRGDSLSIENKLPINLELQPDENYLTFNFSGINMKSPNDVKYRFMLIGAEGELSKKWSNPSTNNFATFSNLSSGDYTFKVQASNDINNWSDAFSEYSFTIRTPFYSSWWFRSLIFIFISSIVYLIYSWRMRSIRQDQENTQLRSQSKMLALEQQTLNANMNRHFVFNALNSIQYYLNKEDKRSANRYLSRFAKLIRKNLDSSQSKQTTLNEEIERMILYMELEQMRFGDKFNFNFTINKALNTRQIKIPSMLFQPYLENSIWHGILPMQDMGHIDVTIDPLNEDSISIKIFDNGIGIDTSMKQKNENPKDHISVGMEITKNRLNLYRQISKKQASVVGPLEIQKEGKTIGTQVELILPLLN